jgi:hypothetical protein
VHDQMRVRGACVDRLDHVHRQDVAIGLARELVGAVRRAAGDRQRVDLGAKHEIERLVRIGQQLVMRELAFRARAVLGFRLAGFQRAEHAELAFHRRADPMRHPRHPLGDLTL